MPCIRKTLPYAKEFKQFWKDNGPFKYALTSNEFPPVLLEPEEWIFGNDKIEVLKDLMGFAKNKMAFVQAPFNPDNKEVLRPDDICGWKITHFPEEWNRMVCDAFVPEGQLTQAVIEELATLEEKENKQGIESAFFNILARQLDQMGYTLIEPRGKSKFASTRAYLEEWEEDEADAGLS
ncbi:MAG TPA: hypothetical protein DHV36_09430 [Desulfobacteraceae bacterium]|nr:hypothetical protein [Desulfobacteraceae bacterium]